MGASLRALSQAEGWRPSGQGQGLGLLRRRAESSAGSGREQGLVQGLAGGAGLGAPRQPGASRGFLSLPAVQAGFAEAPHQNPGNALPAEPAHRSRRLRHAWPPRPQTSRCHHPLPSPDPWTGPFPNATSPRPHHAGPHRLRALLEPLARRGSVRRGGCTLRHGAPGQAALLAGGKP